MRGPRPYQDRVEFYQDRAGRWRWRYIGSGHIMADGAQGYSRRIDAVRGAKRVVGMRLNRRLQKVYLPPQAWGDE